MRRIKLFLFGLLLADCTTPDQGPPYSPQRALKTFQIEEGFRIELFAAEPLVADPVAMDFDEQGRIFVVEMPGYPLDTSPTGKVKLLEDTDCDGYPDQSTVFADNLVLPTGVMRWKQGILVTAAPDVWYFEDTDRDKRADVRKVVLTGFAFSNPQHTVSDPLYALDNGIYLAHEPATRAVIFPDKFGDRGSDIHFPDRADGPRLKNTGRNIRFRPDTHELLALAGSSQFGHTFDEWGHHFLVTNSNHLRHEVMGARYLERNPDLLVSTAMQDMSDHGNAAPVFPITRNPRFEMLTDVGQITSACGLTLYLGGAFSGLGSVSFVAEPVHNLVHWDRWTQTGSTFVAQRVQEEREFLASTDAWFRPVFFYTGPDAALYLVDYYREAIEHPEWMAEEAYQSQDLYRGRDRGRIYRITPDADFPAPAGGLRVGEASSQELIRYLASSNIWWRRTAQRLLVDRQDKTVVPLLMNLARNGSSAVGRVHALWTLEGMGELEATLIKEALEDPEPGGRENAVRLSEGFISAQKHRDTEGLADKLVGMANDPDAKVRFQLLCTLGDLKSPGARSVRHELLFRDIEDTWVQLAVLSAGSDEALPLFQSAASRLGEQKSDARATFFQRVCALIGARARQAEIDQIVRTVAGQSTENSAWWRAASLEGLALGLERRGSAPVRLRSPLLLPLLHSPVDRLRRASLRLLEALPPPKTGPTIGALQRAAGTAGDSQAEPGIRADAVRFLALLEPDSHAELFQALVEPEQPQEVQKAAVQALGRIEGEYIAQLLLERWRTMTPEVRSAAADALLAQAGHAELLVKALEQGRVQPWMLEFRHGRRLIMYPDQALRRRARAVLTRTPEERAAVLERYRAALAQDGDPARGQAVFERVCSRCHSFDGEGGQFGVDLGTIRHRPREMLLLDILVPSQAIAQNYELYVVELKGGGTREGIIRDQTSQAITLIHEETGEEVIGRSRIENLYASQVSAMPDGLENEISVREMADLLAFLKKGKMK